MTEFGSSPCLLDDMCRDPVLMKRMTDGIPELQTRPADEKRWLGDLCKIGGVAHVWDGKVWVSVEEAMQRTYLVQE